MLKFFSKRNAMMTLPGSATKRILVLAMFLLACRTALPCRAMQQANANLMDAIKDNRTALALELLDKGSNVRAVDKEGMSPLMWAVVMQNFEVMKALLAHHLLLERGANVHLKYEEYVITKCPGPKPYKDAKIQPPKTALYYAVNQIQPRIVKMLLQKGARVKGTFDEGNTLLMTAVLSGWPDLQEDPDLEIIRSLLAKGVDINARNDKGKTALQLARENKDGPDVIALLQKAGANE